MSSPKKIAFGILKITLSALLITYLVYSAYTHDQFDVLWQGGVSPTRYLAALALSLLALLITFVRWYFLVYGLGLPIRIWDAIRFGFVGYFFNFVTVGTVGGDAIRAYFVARNNPDRRTEAIATVVVDRLIGLVALFTLTGIVLMCLDLNRLCGDDLTTLSVLETCRWVSVSCGAAGLGLLAILCFFRAFFDWKIWSKLFELPWVGPITRQLHGAGVTYSRRPSIVFGAYLASLPVHAINSIAVFVVATSLPIAHPSLLMHLVAVPLSSLAGVLPLPGGIGAFEGMLAILYRALATNPVASEHGLLVAFGFRVITLIAASIGLVLYFAERKEIAQLRADSEATSE